MPGRPAGGHGAQLVGVAEALELSEAVVATVWPEADWAVADWLWVLLEAVSALDVAVVRPGVATGDPVSVAVAPAEPVRPLRVVALVDPVCDWAVAGSTGTLLESVGDGLAEEQVGLAEAVGLVEALEELSLALAVGEAPGCGAELCDAEVPGAELLGLGVRAGGRLDLGGRTLVTSLTTGNGLSGTAEAPSR